MDSNDKAVKLELLEIWGAGMPDSCHCQHDNDDDNHDTEKEGHDYPGHSNEHRQSCFLKSNYSPPSRPA